MIFSSNIFLFVFLPLFLGVYYLARPAWRSLVIVIGSWGFYAWWRIDFLVLYFAVTLWSYYFGWLIANAKSKKSSLRLCICGVVGSLMVLIYFKYFNFLADGILALSSPDLRSRDVLWTVILPIGVSFFVFESISYLVDIYRKDAEPTRNFTDFAAFLALYPHLIAGPVMRYKDLSAQISCRTHNLAKFSEGSALFMLGLSKKVLIADSVAPLVDTLFEQHDPTFVEAWLGAISYSIQLYFDFSGYSDMAVGLGLMMGFRLINNFNQPYSSTSITDFWHRWHISLSTWLRDYLYIALGGNRKGVIRTYINLFLTMLLGGLWHGANWTFVLWGAWHGSLLCLERAVTKRKSASIYPRYVGWPLTMLWVVIGWVMFRAPNLAASLTFYRGMLGYNGFPVSADVGWKITNFQIAILIVGIVVVIIAPKIRLKTWATYVLAGSRIRIADVGAVSLVIMSFAAILKLGADSYSPFLYFQF